MNDKNCEILFDYLRSILYDTEVDALDIEMLEEPYRKLGKGLQFLQQAVEEMQEYSAELSRGNLSEQPISRDNFLCSNLKNLHANLLHLTWQAKQVAAGDYSQRVSYLGEFSEAFNTMTEQLRERENLLKEEAAKAKKSAEAMKGYTELLIELTKMRQEYILVVDAETKEVLYDNKQGEPDACILGHEVETPEVWEFNDSCGKYYRVNTFPIEWQGKKAYAHILSDVTDEKHRARGLRRKAYRDLTFDTFNRLYFEEYMEDLMEKKQPVTLCFIDIDGLKLVNDNYGHLEGDAYIRRVVSLIQAQFRSSDVFARVGGDEFCIVLPGSMEEIAEAKLKAALEKCVNENEKGYPASFSYGIVCTEKENDGLTLEKLICKADAAMYECKRRNKMKYKGVRS